MKKLISEFHDGLKLKTIKIAAAILIIYSAFSLLFWLFTGIRVTITKGFGDGLIFLIPVLFSAVGLFIGRLLYKSKISNRMIINLEPLVNISAYVRADLEKLKSNTDASSFLINALCFSTPAWGLVMFLTQYDKYPKRTKAAIKFAKRGLILYGIVAFISILISLFILATI